MFKRIWKQRRLLMGGALCLLIVMAMGVWMMRGQTNEVSYRFATAERGTVLLTTAVGGNLRADQQADVTAQIAGTVTVVHVKQGDTVAAGQVLYEVDNTEIETNVAEAYAQYLGARQGEESAKAEKLQAEAERATVHNDPASTPEEKNAATQAVVVAEAGIAAATQRRSAAWQRYENLKQQVVHQTVRAPIAGKVASVSVRVGDKAGEGARQTSEEPSGAEVVIQNGSTLKAFVDINEADISFIKPGQTATVTFDAIPGLTATGTVERIDTIGTSSQSVVTYRAILTLDGIDPRLLSEMTVSTTITLDKKDNVLAVPLTAIKTASNGTKYVEIWEQNAPKRVTVQTGLNGDSAVEITSGLNAGQQVITQTIRPNNQPVNTVLQQKGSQSGTGLGTDAKGRN